MASRRTHRRFNSKSLWNDSNHILQESESLGIITQAFSIAFRSPKPPLLLVVECATQYRYLLFKIIFSRNTARGYPGQPDGKTKKVWAKTIKCNSGIFKYLWKRKSIVCCGIAPGLCCPGGITFSANTITFP